MSTDASNVQPQQLPPAAPPPAPPIPLRRSPGLAMVLSCFPGLGHLYLGLYQRAIGIFVAFAAGIAFADQIEAFGVVVAFIWFFGVIDAYRQAHLLNQGLAPESALGALPKPQRGQGSLGFGVFITALGLLLLYNQFYPIDFSFLYDWWPLILVGFGAYLIARYAIDQRKRRQAEESSREEEWPRTQ